MARGVAGGSTSGWGGGPGAEPCTWCMRCAHACPAPAVTGPGPPWPCCSTRATWQVRRTCRSCAHGTKTTAGRSRWGRGHRAGVCRAHRPVGVWHGHCEGGWCRRPVSHALCMGLGEGSVGAELLLRACLPAQVFVGSAKAGTNVAAIKQWVVSKLPLGPTLYPKVGSRTVLQHAMQGTGAAKAVFAAAPCRPLQRASGRLVRPACAPPHPFHSPRVLPPACCAGHRERPARALLCVGDCAREGLLPVRPGDPLLRAGGGAGGRGARAHAHLVGSAELHVVLACGPAGPANRGVLVRGAARARGC